MSQLQASGDEYQNWETGSNTLPPLKFSMTNSSNIKNPDSHVKYILRQLAMIFLYWSVLLPGRMQWWHFRWHSDMICFDFEQVMTCINHANEPNLTNKRGMLQYTLDGEAILDSGHFWRESSAALISPEPLSLVVYLHTYIIGFVCLWHTHTQTHTYLGDVTDSCGTGM